MNQTTLNASIQTELTNIFLDNCYVASSFNDYITVVQLEQEFDLGVY